MGVERSGPDQRLRDVARAMRGVIELLEVYWTRVPEGFSPVTVSAPQLRVMYVIERREGINLRQLGAELDAAPSSVVSCATGWRPSASYGGPPARPVGARSSCG